MLTPFPSQKMQQYNSNGSLKGIQQILDRLQNEIDLCPNKSKASSLRAFRANNSLSFANSSQSDSFQTDNDKRNSRILRTQLIESQQLLSIYGDYLDHFEKCSETEEHNIEKMNKHLTKMLLYYVRCKFRQ
ncbi:Hypothetical_protein [Hexamita inflata]|uniref:Hypothetical_protein n=1 Tax=Hexamita inflata TaxID=28002 RepID=A0AA86PJG2_9EUKA|nr:Hypothetical protein HINF_LOCUS24412 [Hexamita inflata]